MNSEIAEKALIGAIINKSEAYDLLKSKVSSDDFSNRLYSSIYKTVAVMRMTGKEITPITISEHDSKIPLSSLLEIFKDTVFFGVQALNSYADMVKSYSEKRKIASVLDEGLKELNRKESNPASIKAKLIHSLNKEKIKGDSKACSVKNYVVNEYVTKWEKIIEGNDSLDLIRTGFSRLDELIQGFRSGEIYVLAGRPASGKSALAINLAANISKGGNVLFMSLEMPRAQVFDRFMANQQRVNISNISNFCMTESEETRFCSVDRALEHNLFVDDYVYRNYVDLLQSIQCYHEEMGLRLVVIDYLQLLHMKEKYSSRVEAIDEIMWGIKQLSVQLGIPVLLLSQMNRQGEATNNRPALSNLKGSGAIEQDATAVMFLWKGQNAGNEIETERKFGTRRILSIEKNRHGTVGDVMFDFNGEFMEFIEVEKSQVEITAWYEKKPLKETVRMGKRW